MTKAKTIITVVGFTARVFVLTAFVGDFIAAKFSECQLASSFLLSKCYSFYAAIK